MNWKLALRDALVLGFLLWLVTYPFTVFYSAQSYFGGLHPADPSTGIFENFITPFAMSCAKILVVLAFAAFALFRRMKPSVQIAGTFFLAYPIFCALRLQFSGGDFAYEYAAESIGIVIVLILCAFSNFLLKETKRPV